MIYCKGNIFKFYFQIKIVRVDLPFLTPKKELLLNAQSAQTIIEVLSQND